MQRRRRQFSDNPAIETPEDDAHTFNERYKVGRAAHACLCSHGTHASNSGSDSAKEHIALHYLFAFEKGTCHQHRCGRENPGVSFIEQTARG